MRLSQIKEPKLEDLDYFSVWSSILYKEVIGWHGLSDEPIHSSASCGQKNRNLATRNLQGKTGSSPHSCKSAVWGLPRTSREPLLKPKEGECGTLALGNIDMFIIKPLYYTSSGNTEYEIFLLNKQLNFLECWRKYSVPSLIPSKKRRN